MFAAIPWDDDWCTHYAVAPHEHRLCYTRRQLSRSLAVRSAATIEQQLIDRLAKTIQAKELMIGEGSAVIPKQRIEEPAVVPIQLAPARRQARWRLALGVLMTGGILALAFFNRAWLLEAVGLARAAQPAWLLLGLLTIASSFLISSQVFQVALRALGQRVGVLRFWATAVVAIVTSAWLMHDRPGRQMR